MKVNGWRVLYNIFTKSRGQKYFLKKSARKSKNKVFKDTCTKTCCKNRTKILPTLFLLASIPYDIASILTGKKYGDNIENYEKILKYWMNRSIPEIIREADKLFEQGSYLEVYELLNRVKYIGNVDIQWRISRCLFKLSGMKGIADDIKNEMILEAYGFITSALAAESENFNIHKWMAILLDAKCGIEGTECRVRHAAKIKEHMLKAYELNPNDVVILYMLGKWCFEMSRLTFFQRCIAKLLYATPPDASYDEAYFFFKKAYDLENQFYYIPNIYLLGQTCFHLGQYFRALFYLKLAAQLPPRTEYEKICVDKAKYMVENLSDYDLTNETVLFEFPFDVEP